MAECQECVSLKVAYRLAVQLHKEAIDRATGTAGRDATLAVEPVQKLSWKCIQMSDLLL